MTKDQHSEVGALIDDPRVELAGLFLETHRGLIARLAAVHREHGLPGNEFTCLLRLSRSPRRRLRMSDLAVQTSMSTSGITTVVERLLGAGLVDRTVAPGDRRSLVIELTDAGMERLGEDLADLVGVIETSLVEPLGHRRAEFEHGLRQVRDVVAPQAGQVTG